MHSNIRNRLFSLLLTFAMLFALFPTSALAADSGAQLPDNWENCTDCSAENPHLIWGCGRKVGLLTTFRTINT